MLLCVLFQMGSAAAQEVVYPFNPDATGDSQIYVADIIEVLALYESEFTPSPILVDGITLEAYLIQLNAAIAAVAAGADGEDGTGIAAIVDNGDGTLTFELTDGSTFTTANLTGPAGAAGAPGADGVDGAPGADGVDGVPGAPGADGVPGAPGADGVDGAPGADGVDGAPGADGVGVQNIAVSPDGQLGVVLTNGTVINLGCVVDADNDGICDGNDQCTDLSAANYSDEGNGACEYNKWFIPEVLGAGPAIYGTELPLGYREGHFDCVQGVVDEDPYCITYFWDGLCDGAYQDCLSSDEVLLAGFDYDVGDVGPAGGIIVYVDTFDIHRDFDYLEAASEDFVGTGAFDGIEAELFSLDCSLLIALQPLEEEGESGSVSGSLGGGGGELLTGGYRVRHAGGTAIGTGLSNTLELERYGACSYFVAKQVLKYQQNGFRDFFIPSIAELEVMAAVLGPLGNDDLIMIGGGGGGGGGGGAFSTLGMSGEYWSSSEFDALEGYGVFIINLFSTSVLTSTNPFSLPGKIRPVRAF